MTIGIEKRNQVYSYLETHPGVTQIQLRKAFPKLHTSDVSHLVAEFCREGLAVSDGRSPRRYWAVSLIPEDERCATTAARNAITTIPRPIIARRIASSSSPERWRWIAFWNIAGTNWSWRTDNDPLLR